MNKFQVKGDPNNPPRFSSSVIINSLNFGAKNLGVYSEEEKLVVYDTCASQHGYNADAIICCYEFSLPRMVSRNAQGKPLIAVSRDNLCFLLEGGYPKEKVSYIDLGVDSTAFKKVTKTKFKDKFVCLCYTESLVRSGLELLIEGFGKAFSGNKDSILYIKDRNALPEFEIYVRERAKFFNIEIIYENSHLDTIEKVLDLFSVADCHFYPSYSTTWGMCVLESMSCGLPTASPMFSGPRSFISDKMTGIGIEFDLEEITDEKINKLKWLGMRSFFFPMNRENFNIPPYWAKCRVDSIAKNLILLKNDSTLRSNISFCGRKMAEELTWERSALQLSYVLSRFG